MKPSLLIVDDDEAIRTQLKYALRDDYTLGFAEDRAQALALFADMHPAVVSLDLGLPPRSEVKYSHWPSGEKRGSVSIEPDVVSRRRGPLPSALMR